MTSNVKSWLWSVVAAGGLALAGWFIFQELICEPPAAELAEAAPRIAVAPAAIPSAAIVQTSGGVEIRRSGQDWVAARAGDRLHEDDVIRTGVVGTADVQVNDRSQLRIVDGSEIELDELTRLSHRFKLRRGRVAVDYATDGERVLRIEDEAGAVVAEARAATFDVLATDAAFVVATKTGGVQLSAAGAKVDIGAGEESRVDSGATPSPATPIARELLLDVARARAPVGAPCAIEGRTASGAEVRVNAGPATLRPDGTFSVAVANPPAAGVQVVVRDAAGRSETKIVKCEVTPKEGRIEKFGVRWGEGAPP